MEREIGEVHPIEELKSWSQNIGIGLLDERFAAELDRSNSFPTYRHLFLYPKRENGDDCIYFCGHSLGLQSVYVKNGIYDALQKWANMGLNSYFEGEDAWLKLDEMSRPVLAKIVGATTNEEVAILNSLSVNLHLLLVSFYRPTQTRYKILMEDRAFPSDHFIAQSQAKLHDLKPEEAIIALKPREKEHVLRTEDILEAIDLHGDQVAVVLFSGVQYSTGQLFDIERIVKAAHAKGCFVGFDLAHAVGNVPLRLHDWNVDFAVWTSYKYLNGGPGCIGGLFLHERHFDSVNQMKKLDGWWGNRLETRLQVMKNIEYAKGASKYALSTSSVVLLKCLSSSLEVFKEVDMNSLHHKSRLLTAYLEYLLQVKLKPLLDFEQITPSNPNERGAHLSILFGSRTRDGRHVNMKLVGEKLYKEFGCILDSRKQSVIRIAPVPLYNTFHEVYKFVDALYQCVHDLS